MQLLMLLLLLAYGGKTEQLKQMQPLLESLGGEEVASAFKSAEELGSVISAVQDLATNNGASLGDMSGAFSPKTESAQGGEVDGFPLAPIANIADEGITYSLSRYISTGE